MVHSLSHLLSRGRIACAVQWFVLVDCFLFVCLFVLKCMYMVKEKKTFNFNSDLGWNVVKFVRAPPFLRGLFHNFDLIFAQMSYTFVAESSIRLGVAIYAGLHSN